MKPSPRVTVKHLEPVSALVLRRPIDGHTEALTILSELRRLAEGSVCGPSICVIYGRTAEGKLDAELAVPVADGLAVSDSLAGMGAERKMLPADDFLHVEHVGPYELAADLPGIRETVGQLSLFASEQSLLIGDNPSRYVYREGEETHGQETDKYATDILVSYHLPIWLRALREGISAAEGDASARDVLTGSEVLMDGFDADRLRAWVRGAMDRVDRVVPNPSARACILNGCAHRHPQTPLDRWKSAYEEADSLDAFVDRLIEDKELYPPRAWREPGLAGNTLFVERVVPPWNREAYDKATDPKEKRYHACFCAMMKEAILNDEPVSPTFCHCSGGWFVQIWEAILGKTLHVDVVSSVLQGDDRCVFAIHLPEGEA